MTSAMKSEYAEKEKARRMCIGGALVYTIECFGYDAEELVIVALAKQLEEDGRYEEALEMLARLKNELSAAKKGKTNE